AVGSRTSESAQRFAKVFPGITAHGSYEALLADENVDIIYIATPHPLHAQWAIRCAQAGRHILCEKPLTMNHAEAVEVIEAASGQPFLDPVEVKGVGQIGGESRVDEFAIASLKFPNGVLAQLAAGVRLELENFVRIWGDDGNVLVRSPWFAAGHTAGESKIIV